MDRLLCGDVGFGKTELAVRAAFKAVLDGKQVAVLVPTTVLAQQHYLTFGERFQSFPVKVEMLSRFRSDAEAADIVRRLQTGEIDVVIGTHRLLQKDVRFKDLALGHPHPAHPAHVVGRDPRSVGDSDPARRAAADQDLRHRRR
jgi:transcription-repair coupling factor (superfamily II helicase)